MGPAPTLANPTSAISAARPHFKSVGSSLTKLTMPGNKKRNPSSPLIDASLRSKVLSSPSGSPSGRPSAELPLRSKVLRGFNGRWYEGEIKERVEPQDDDEDQRPWYRVEYADGDAEDLTPAQAEEAAAAHRRQQPGAIAARAAVLPSALERCLSASKLYEPVEATSLDCLLLKEMDPMTAARLLLSMKPPKAVEAPKPVAPSRFRKNHQAMTKPFQLPDGTFPCAKGCGRCFAHAPASVAHSKACKFVRA